MKIHPFLGSLANLENSLHKITKKEFRLDQVKTLLSALDNPQNKLSIIHVAGSKGKGSVSAMTASILSQQGYKVGLYTSPHLIDLRERIQVVTHNDLINSKDSLIPLKILNCWITHIQTKIDELKSNDSELSFTFFEVMTVLALCYFVEKKVDWVVLETGLGGRLDTTNVCPSKIAVITPISLEHTKILGSTIAKIAKEKIAIVKESKCGVVIADQKMEAVKVIKKHCDHLGIKPYWVKKNIECQWIANRSCKQIVNFRSKENRYDAVKLGLLGKHQQANASTVLAVIESLIHRGVRISSNAIRKGLQNVCWPARCEILNHKPVVIIDGAHNAESLRYFLETVEEIYPRRTKHVIFGTSIDKDRKAMSKYLRPYLKNMIFTKSAHPRAWIPKSREIKKLMKIKEAKISSSLHEALEMVYNIAKLRDVILVTGSLFLASEAKQCINSKE